MLKLKKVRFILIYFLIGFSAIFFEYTLQKSMQIIFKPLICFSLILFLIDNKQFKNFLSIYIALICGLLGDFLLIFPQYFVFGLIAFLFGHIMYTYSFIRQNEIRVHLNKFVTRFIISLVIVYLLLFYDYIKLNLGGLKLPVLIYMIVISLMFISAYFRKRVDGYYYVIIGAAIFIVSDSLIAINKFVSPFLYSNELVLITYIFAQFLIVFGFTKYTITISKN
jgi:uncharacterized membrane protein YhhN